jgi:hypothetical protein
MPDVQAVSAGRAGEPSTTASSGLTSPSRLQNLESILGAPLPHPCFVPAATASMSSCLFMCALRLRKMPAHRGRGPTLSQLYCTRQPARLQKDIAAFSTSCVPFLARAIQWSTPCRRGLAKLRKHG